MRRADGGRRLWIAAAGSAVFGVRSGMDARDWDFNFEIVTDHGQEIYAAAVQGASAADIIVIPVPMLEALAQDGLLSDPSPRAIGWTGIGYCGPARLPAIAIEGKDGLRRAITRARQVFVTSAPTGRHMLTVCASLGLDGLLVGKLRQFDRADAMLATLVDQQAPTLAFAPTTEIAAWRGKGVVDCGPVPVEFDLPLAYGAAVLASARHRDEAHQAIEWLAGPEGLERFRASGMQA